jgi:hypothetical protein
LVPIQYLGGSGGGRGPSQQIRFSLQLAMYFPMPVPAASEIWFSLQLAMYFPMPVPVTSDETLNHPPYSTRQMVPVE